MLDSDALCPHCKRKFRLSMIGLEAKEFIRCPHCREMYSLNREVTEPLFILRPAAWAGETTASLQGQA